MCVCEGEMCVCEREIVSLGLWLFPLLTSYPLFLSLRCFVYVCGTLLMYKNGGSILVSEGI